MHAEVPADDDLEEDDEVDDDEDNYEEEKPAKRVKGAAGKAAGGKKGGQAAKGIILMYFLISAQVCIFLVHFVKWVLSQMCVFLNLAQEHTGAALTPFREAENRLLGRDKTCHACI